MLSAKLTVSTSLQFVDFTKIMSTEMSQADKEDRFTLEALKKIPAQYAHIINQRIRYLSSNIQRGIVLKVPTVPFT